jgi:peptidoglycan/LPS O-acetylase OafA/YrhL
VAALALAGTSLAFDFRTRVALACCTAALLWWFHPDTRTGVQPLPTRTARWLTQLGQQAYALFLVHFSVLLLTNVLYSIAMTDTAVATAEHGTTDATELLFLAIGWGFSMALAAVFFRYIEQPLAAWQRTLNAGKPEPKR